MAPAATPRRIVRFGVYELNRDTGELRKGGLKIKLQDQPFQVLAMLVERPGELITREELLNRLWPSGTFVDFDHGLNVAVKKLRQALGDTAENPRFVETLSRRGYRFVGPVENVPTDSEGGSEGLPGTAASVEPALRSARSLPWVLVGFSLMAAASALWHWWPANPARPVITRFTISLPPSDQFSMPRGGLAISPDGRYDGPKRSSFDSGNRRRDGAVLFAGR
jgi:DNA-binding winged helix-turn-helix (wHTH) protein